MTYNNIYDMHTHSNNSFDGNDSCEALCEQIIAKCGKGIAITDHCDIDGIKEDCWSFEDKQFKDVQFCKEKYKDIDIFCGVELGQGIYEKELSEKFLAKYDFDFVLGSIHNLKDLEDFYFLDYNAIDVDNLLKRYFTDVLELVKWNKTDSIAHLTYPLRYIVAREHIEIDISKHQEIIDEIFKTIINNDKALEINVSGLSMEMNDTLPSKALIKRYRELGGKYITVGSDSHYANLVCNNIEKGYDIIKECGFDHFTVFEKRQPKLIKII